MTTRLATCNAARMTTLRRRPLVLLLLVALLTAACGGGDDGGTSSAPSEGGTGAATAEVKTLRVASLPIADLGAYFYAIQNGIFDRNQLKVENTSVASGQAGIAAMTGGELDLVYTNNVSVMLSADKGLPITIVSGGNDNTPEGERDMAVMVAPSSIADPKQLAGKTIATNALNNVTWLYQRAWLREQGVDPDSVKMVEIPYPEQPAAILEGRIQGALIPEPFASNALSQGAKSLGFPFRIGGGRTYLGSFVATPKFAEDNADAMQRFRQSLDEANEEVAQPANREKLFDAIAANTRIQRQQLSSIVLPSYSAEVPKDLLENTAELMVQEKMLTKAPDVGKLIFKP